MKIKNIFFQLGLAMLMIGVGMFSGRHAEAAYSNVNFTTIGGTTNGYAQDSYHGSVDIPGITIYFIGITSGGSGYFQVYDATGASVPGVSGSSPATQAYFKIATLNTATNFNISQFDVYNPNGSSVSLDVNGWNDSNPHPPTTGDVTTSATASANSWTTVNLTGFTGISSFTIDFPDNTPLYFNQFYIESAMVSVPTLTTTAMSSITTTTAASGGTISASGGAAVTARGVCWNTTGTPTTADSKTTDGTGTGVFTSSLTGLSGNTTYYVRAYATNSAGTAYGNQISFTTAPFIGQFIMGDGSGSGGGGASGAYQGGNGGNGGGGDDTIAGTNGSDIIFGDGGGGGTGGRGVGLLTGNTALAGTGGGGADTIAGGNGNDIIFGDGFNGIWSEYWGGNGGFGGGGGGGSGAFLGGALGGQAGLGGGCGSGYAGSQAVLVAGFGNAGGSGDASGGNSATSIASVTGIGGLSYGSSSQSYGGGGAFGGAAAADGRNTAGPGISGVNGNTDEHRYDDTSASISTYVLSVLSSILTNYPSYGAGNDTINGNAGSDNLFGLGGNDTFVFERNEAGASDVDTIWDFKVSGTDILYLTIGGTMIDGATRDALIAAQTISGNDRSLTFTDGGAHQVTITLKSLGRDIVAGDFAGPPSATTTSISSITAVSASSGGTVPSDGGFSVTARGVCWNTGGAPTIADSTTIDGSGTGAFTSSLTGLGPATTYHVRAYATNSQGTAYGNEISFTTAPTIPTLTTTAATNIMSNSASGGGDISFDGGAAVTARGLCWNTTGSPSISDSTTTDGSGPGAFTSSLTGLGPATVYYVRAYATNSQGTAYGNTISFTTTATIPTLTTISATTITSNSASSGGDISFDGGATVTARGICWNTTGAPTLADLKTLDGGGPGTFTSSLADLQPVKTYYVRAYATNSEGTAYGNELSFTTTAAISTLTTTAATTITSNSASSGGDISLDGGATVTARGVCWNTTGTPTIADSTTTDGSGAGSFTSTLTGLNPVTTYYVRAYATNSAGTAYGNEFFFTTEAAIPTLTTTAAATITSTSASSGGDISFDGGAAVTVRGICWNTTGSPTIADSKTIDGSGPGAFTSSLTDLTSATTYYVSAYATNSVGTAYGNEIAFTTLTGVPLIITEALSLVTENAASVGGNISSDGGASVTARGICWNTTGAPTTADSKTTDGIGTGAFTSSLTGLSANTTYYVRAYATNSMGTAYGDQMTCATLSVTWPEATAITYGDTLANAPLNKGAVTQGGNPVSGIFAFTEPAIMPGVGSASHGVMFTPATSLHGTLAGSVSVTVSPKSLTIKANNITKAYGEELSLGSSAFSITSGMLLGGDSISSVSLESMGAVATAPVGTYSIMAGLPVGTGLMNYAITYVDGTLTVTPSPLTLKADNREKTYGDELILGTTGFSIISGSLKNSDTITGVTLASAGAESGASAGTYPITPSNAVGQGVDNYTLTYEAGSMTVVKALPTVTAWPAASALIKGDALSMSALTGGESSVTGSFAFDAPGTTPDAGESAHAVTFTPADPVNYHPVFGSVNVTTLYPPKILSVGKAGSGAGSIMSSPSGVTCGGTCSASYPHGATVTLRAIPDAGSTFTGWSGDATGSGDTASVVMTESRSVVAGFALKSAFELTDDILDVLEKNGVPSDLTEQMESSIGMEFLSEEAFMDYLKTLIGEKELRKYETLILENIETETLSPPVFKITGEVLKDLKDKGLPANVIAKLNQMIHQGFESMESFTQYLKTLLGENEAALYEVLILESTYIPSIKPASFMISDEVLAQLSTLGVPSDIIEQLARMTEKEFSSPEDFMAYLESVIGLNEAGQYETQLLSTAYTPPETEASFQLTREALTSLSANGVPRGIIDKISRLTDKLFLNEAEFFDYLKGLIGDADAFQYQYPILEESAIPTVTPEGFVVTDEVMESLVERGVPEEIIDALEQMVGELFLDQEMFMASLANVMDGTALNQYQAVILDNASVPPASPASFSLTDQDLRKLAGKGLPETVIAQLSGLTYREYTSADSFMGALTALLGESQALQYESLFMREAAMRSRINYALDLTGMNGFVEVPDTSTPFTTASVMQKAVRASGLSPEDALTIELWIYFNTAPKNWNIVSKTDGALDSGYSIHINESGELICQVWKGDGTPLVLNAGAAPSSGTWHHLAMTWRQGGRFIAYIDGLPTKNIAGGDDPLSVNSSPVLIGGAMTASGLLGSFDGKIDEVRIWATDLDKEMLQRWLNKEVTIDHPDYDSLVACYRMNLNTGTTVYDSKGMNDGVIIGSITWQADALTTVLQPLVLEEALLAPQDGIIPEGFGSAVAISGDDAAVGSAMAAINGAGSGAVHLFKRVGSAWTESARLVPSDGEAKDNFGVSVAISGDRVIVGSFKEDHLGKNAGAAYIFSRTPSGWVEEAKLMAADGAAGDHFGSSVAIAGSVAAVGARSASSGQGVVYVFTSENGLFTQKQRLTSPGMHTDAFGEALALGSDYLAAGDSLNSDKGTGAGAIHVFKKIADLWEPSATLHAADANAHAGLGVSLSLSGQTLIAGAYGDDEKGSHAGAAYIFEESNGIWNQAEKLMPMDGSSFDSFGMAVALSGKYAAVGAPQDDYNGQGSGSLYLYEYHLGEWRLQDKLSADQTRTFDGFGVTLSLSGSDCLAGAAMAGDNNNRNNSPAYLFSQER